MFSNILCQIGFTDKESKVFLELLKIGAQAVSTIAKRSGFNRTTTYSILLSLEKKGVLSSYVNNNVKFFSANDPNTLVAYLDQKSRTFDYYREQLLTVIPKFRELISDYHLEKPLVKYFDGIEGVKQVMNDALNANKEFCTFLPLHKWLDFGMEDFLIKFRNIRITNKKVKLKAIIPDNKKVRDFFSNNYPNNHLTELLFIPEPEFEALFKNQINIYNDKMAIIHLDKGEEYAVIIRNRDIVEAKRTIFELAWLGCKMKIENLKKHYDQN
jgi:sugar-specific transcriptional regulator TrmB